MVNMDEIEAKMSFWKIAKQLGVNENVEQLHDKTIPWINDNRTKCIDQAIKNDGDRLVSKLLAWKNYVCKQSNYSVPLGTVEEFQNSMSFPIKMWRGGAGLFDPNWSDGRNWTSFTGDRTRANTFSVYAGTNASKSFRLPKNTQFWIVELTVSIQDILLYLPHGYDEEFIIPLELSKQATLIDTTSTNAA